MASEPLLQEIDPFRDGLAGQRIGQYLRCYLEGWDDGQDRDTALARADLRYAEEWGAGKVRQLVASACQEARTKTATVMPTSVTRDGSIKKA